MQRFWDKWGLQSLAVLIGAVIIYGLFFAPGRPEDEKKGPGSKNAAGAKP